MHPNSSQETTRTVKPYVNYLFILINILVFVALQESGWNKQFTFAFALFPKEIVTGIDLTTTQFVMDPATGQSIPVANYATPFPVYCNFLSSMFMHAGFVHLFGNLFFLWVFGDNVEKRLGHIRYAWFYVLCGFAAALTQVVLTPDSVIPLIGASGAISGVLGGFLMLDPKRRIQASLFYRSVKVPAYIVLAMWALYQSIVAFMTPTGIGGVAYTAHIGGAIAGLVLIGVITIGKSSESRVAAAIN